MECKACGATLRAADPGRSRAYAPIAEYAGPRLVWELEQRMAHLNAQLAAEKPARAQGAGGAGMMLISAEAVMALFAVQALRQQQETMLFALVTAAVVVAAVAYGMLRGAIASERRRSGFARGIEVLRGRLDRAKRLETANGCLR